MVGIAVHFNKCGSKQRVNVGIAVYWNKFKTKQPLNEGLEINWILICDILGILLMKLHKTALLRNIFLLQTMIMVPNPTKCIAFTLQQIMAVTHNFSRKIGEGGFGSVFFGKLPEGRDIAVKVLSQFSRQGIHEFHTEVININLHLS